MDGQGAHIVVLLLDWCSMTAVDAATCVFTTACPTAGIVMHCCRVRTLVLHILRQLLQWRGLTEAANAALLQALLAAIQPNGPQANSSGGRMGGQSGRQQQRGSSVLSRLGWPARLQPAVS